MLFGSKEIDIIEYLQSLDNSEICFPVDSDEAINVLEKIHNKELWKNWSESSGKADPPPDFFSDEYKLMIDVMRVNDTERKGKKGKLYNPNITHERELFRELQDKGLVEIFPDANYYIIGDTGLTTFEDHNYMFYKKNFIRVISKHIDSIPLYKSNHPGFKVIFVVYDESTAYVQLENDIDKSKPYQAGQQMIGIPHYFFADKAFINCFIDKGIDYLFWLAPHKLIKTHNEPLILPRLSIFDLSKSSFKSLEYIESRMTSSEI